MDKLVYIFLDIDGVLDNRTYLEECYERHHKPTMSMNCFPFDPKCLNNLMILFQKLEEKNFIVKIILSSTWRLSEIDTQIVNHRLAEYGMRVFDKTGNINGQRGLEIKDYLDNHNKCINYIVLDDDIFDIKDIIEDKHIVNTSFETGFTEECLKEAVKKLNLED